MYEAQFPPQTSPRPFGEIPGLWTKVLQMTEDFFAQEAPRTSGSNTLIGVLILAVISAVLAALSSLVGGGFQAAGMPAEYRDTFAASTGGLLTCSLCIGLLGTVIGFYLGNGLIYLGARVLGGTGSFGPQTYLQSLFSVPLGAAMSVVSLVYAIPVAGPCIGGIALLALGIYSLVLNVRAVKVVHNLTGGRAFVAIILWPIVLFLVIACLAVVVLVLLGPTIGNMFENIVNNVM